jgi:hypothetical protein
LESEPLAAAVSATAGSAADESAASETCEVSAAATANPMPTNLTLFVLIICALPFLYDASNVRGSCFAKQLSLSIAKSPGDRHVF